MSSYYEDIIKFHRAFDMPVSTRPNDIPYNRIQLRKKLMREELNELIEELDQPDINLVAAAKESADVIVTVLGTMVEFGLPFDKIWKAVCDSNMSKLSSNGQPIMRDDGKALKGPNYKDPLSVISSAIVQASIS